MRIEKWIGVIQVIGGVGRCEGKGFRHREKYMQKSESMRVQEGRAGTHKQNLMKVAAGSTEPARGGEAPRDEGQVTQEAGQRGNGRDPVRAEAGGQGVPAGWVHGERSSAPTTRGRSQGRRLPSLCPI